MAVTLYYTNQTRLFICKHFFISNNFAKLVKVLKSLSREKRNCVIIIRIILTAGTTSATPERSFSMLRRIKTWLRSRKVQKRCNSLSILYDSKDILTNVLLLMQHYQFVKQHPDGKNTFGCFTTIEF